MWYRGLISLVCIHVVQRINIIGVYICGIEDSYHWCVYMWYRGFISLVCIYVVQRINIIGVYICGIED